MIQIHFSVVTEQALEFLLPVLRVFQPSLVGHTRCGESCTCTDPAALPEKR